MVRQLSDTGGSGAGEPGVTQAGLRSPGHVLLGEKGTRRELWTQVWTGQLSPQMSLVLVKERHVSS